LRRPRCRASRLLPLAEKPSSPPVAGIPAGGLLISPGSHVSNDNHSTDPAKRIQEGPGQGALLSPCPEERVPLEGEGVGLRARTSLGGLCVLVRRGGRRRPVCFVGRVGRAYARC